MIEFAGKRMRSTKLSPAKLRRFDCAVIATAHRSLPYGTILRYSKGVVDTRNALPGRRSPKITRL
jgi:UDP-N-acetyl-D-mannosaminuronate dehydrogenase